MARHDGEPVPHTVRQLNGGRVDASWSGIWIAVVGVAGTLGAAVLTQSRADRARRLENLEQNLERRRTCYITLNTSARQYLTAMSNYLHALENDEDVPACLESLEAARLAYRDSYAEAQMVVPNVVFDASRAAKKELNHFYGDLKRYGADPSAYASELADLHPRLHDVVWRSVGALRRSMRVDLGVDR
ncbi:hypothetical protein [Streptomyces canus]|uniref:hypothetical protein n=1 Tax=Streptomyces canus TaxID=58343 RepID=UPI00277F3E35|nr:hypothetical protein [Streptomyces canus]MDQ0757709.1 hypothetical protein [Streptomyces canus]